MTPEVEITGVNPINFPHPVTWEWPVAAYLFLGGLVAGLMIFSAAFRLRREPVFNRAVRIADLTSLPLLASGLVFLWIDLANRWNAWRFFTTFQVRSAMSWGSWILLLSGLVLVMRLLRHFPNLHPVLRRAGVRAVIEARWVDLVTIGLGLGLGFYTGVLLSTVSARPLWNSAALAPLFLVSGLAAGGAYLCLWIAEDAHRRLVPLSLLLCGVEGLLLLAYLVSLGFGTLATEEAGAVLMTGGLGAAFWLLVVLAGLAIPLTIESLDWLRRQVPRWATAAAPYLKLTGSAALRFVIVFAGLRTFI